MSRSLGRLRALLDDPLLLKTKEGMVPTPRALELEEPLRRTLAEWRGIIGTDGVDPHAARRVFRIAMADYAETLLAAPLVARTLPLGLRIDIVALAQGAPQRAVITGLVDVTIAALGDVSGLAQQELLHDRFVTILRRDHPLLLEGPLDLDGFLRTPQVVCCPRSPGDGFVDRVLAKRGEQRTIALTTPRFGALVGIVARSDCLATLPSRAVKMSPHADEVVVLESPLKMPAIALSGYWAERFTNDPLHSKLRHHLFDVCSELEARSQASTPVT